MQKNQSQHIYTSMIKDALSGKFKIQKPQKQSFVDYANNIAVIAQYRNVINKNLQLIKRKVLNLENKIDQSLPKNQLKQIAIYLKNAISLNNYQSSNNSLVKFLENQIMAKISTFLDLIEANLPVNKFYDNEQNDQLKQILNRIIKSMNCTCCERQNLKLIYEQLVKPEETKKSQNSTENNKYQNPTDQQFEQNQIVYRIMDNINLKHFVDMTQIQKESLIERLIKIEKYYSLLLKQQIPISTNSIKSLYNNEQIKKKNAQMQKIIQQKQKYITQIQDKSQEQINKLKQQIEDIKKQKQKIHDLKTQLEKQIKQNEQKQEQYQLSVTNLNNQLTTIKQQLEKTKQQQRKIQQQNDNLKSTTTKLQNQLNMSQDFERKIQSLETLLKQQRTKMMGYSSGILYPYLDLAAFLQSSLEKEMERTIQRTQLVYKQDTLNPTNMMLYFPGRTNLLLIVQTINNHFIACFTEAGPEANSIKQHKKGLIMSLTNKKVFGLNHENPSTRPVTFEDYYLIFGNSEFRIKSGQKYVFSNLGILNKFYQNYEYTVDVLFGEGSNRQVGLENYQVYQLTFSK